jgi:hypothetical protein
MSKNQTNSEKVYVEVKAGFKGELYGKLCPALRKLGKKYPQTAAV